MVRCGGSKFALLYPQGTSEQIDKLIITTLKELEKLFGTELQLNWVVIADRADEQPQTILDEARQMLTHSKPGAAQSLRWQA